MKKILVLILITTLFIMACSALKDQELSLERKDYIENELRLDGYYYNKENEKVFIKFLFKNGVILSAYSLDIDDFESIDFKLINMYNRLKEDKSRWGVFIVEDKSIQYEQWSTSVGGGLPTFKAYGVIENDSTFRITRTVNSDGREFEKDDVYYFRQFDHKPDSTNNFIK